MPIFLKKYQVHDCLEASNRLYTLFSGLKSWENKNQNITQQKRISDENLCVLGETIGWKGTIWQVKSKEN